MENKPDYYSIDRMSNSAMKEFARSPRHFLHYKRTPKTPTPAMIFGNVFHTLVLEPDTFLDRYVIVPPDAPKKPTSAQLNAPKPTDKALESITWWDKFNKENASKIVVSQEDIKSANDMIDALYVNDFARELMESITQTEKELFWKDDVTGVEMKGKWDGGNDMMTLDLKTCENAHPDEFSRQAYTLGYDRQAALYMDGRDQLKMNKGDFYFIAIEKSEPYGISVMKASKDFIEHGRMRYSKILEDYAHWLEMGSPDVGYQWTAPLGFHSLNLPSWIK